MGGLLVARLPGLHAAAGFDRPDQGAAQAQSGLLVAQAHSGEIVELSEVGEFTVVRMLTLFYAGAVRLFYGARI